MSGGYAAPVNRTSLLLLSSAIALGALGCGDDDTPLDTGMDVGGDAGDAGDTDTDTDTDTGPPPTCDGVDPLTEGGEGHADPLGSAAGEARAGRVPAGSLPADPTDLLTWTEEDWVLANDRVAIVIEAVGTSDGYDSYGGKPVGMAKVEGGALVEPADFNEFILAVGRYTFDPRSVGVLNDGSDGEAAVIRAVGPLRTIAFIDEFASALYSADYDDIEVAVDYTLAPDADVVDVTFTFASPRVSDARANQVVLAFQTSRMPAYAPEVGFEVDGEVPWLGFVEDTATSYALESQMGALSLSLEVSGTMLVTGERFEIPACAQTPMEQYRIHIGGPGLDGLKAAIAETNGTATRTVTGRVLEPGGEGAVGVRVHAEAGEAHVSRSMTDATGAFSLTIPADQAVTLSTWRVGNAVASVEVAAAETTAELTLDATGFVEVAATEDGLPVPARVQVRPASGSALRPAGSWGEPTPPNGRLHQVFPGLASATLRVPVGDSRVTVSRGMEYEIGFDDTVTVTAGETVPVAAPLTHVVDTTGVMCADYHIHTSRSPDSPDGAEFKLRSAAGDGLDIPCRSDHEWVYEWTDLIAREGLEDYLFGVTSLELTTFEYGHFGVFPLVERPELPNRGAIDWVGMTPPEVFDVVRAQPTDPVLIINHPRGSVISSYFSAAGYDPVTGEVEHPEMWDETFRIVEVFNDSSFDQNFEETVQDWFSFLRAGRRVFAVGSSDSHKVQGGSPVGYPRTCADLGMDTPAELRAADGANLLRNATRDGHFYVSGGIHLDVVARGGARPGDEMPSAMASETVRVRVSAPSWVDVDTLEVFVDGEMTSTMMLGAGDGVIRADIDVPVAIAAGGSFVIFHAKGDMPLDPVLPGRMPFAVSQPIFFQR